MSRGTSNYPTASNFASNQISLDTRLFPIRAQTQLLASAAPASIKEPSARPSPRHPPPLIVATANRGERHAATTNGLSSRFRRKFVSFFQAAIKRKYNVMNFTSCAIPPPPRQQKNKKKTKLSRSKINAVCSKGEQRERGAGPSNRTTNNKSTAGAASATQ